MMKRLKFFVLRLLLCSAILFSSCKKNAVTAPVPAPQAELIYTDLHDTAVFYQQPVTVFDFDGDGFSDLKFGVVLVGDPILQQDKRQFMVSSGIHSKLAVNAASLVPVVSKGDIIPLDGFNGYDWWLVSSVLLVERIENIHGEISWQGHWKGASKKYLPFQMIKNNQRYSGWVEISVDVLQGKIVLHRLAMSKEAEKEIEAG